MSHRSVVLDKKKQVVVTILHDGDYNGEIEIIYPGNKSTIIENYQVLEDFILEKLKNDKIREIEDMSNDEFKKQIKL